MFARWCQKSGNKHKTDENEEVDLMDPITVSWSEELENYLNSKTISPYLVYKIFWDSFVAIVFMFGIFTTSFILAFHMHFFANIVKFDSLVDYVGAIDIISTFFTFKTQPE